jgi:hypothetical protein
MGDSISNRVPLPSQASTWLNSNATLKGEPEMRLLTIVLGFLFLISCSNPRGSDWKSGTGTPPQSQTPIATQTPQPTDTVSVRTVDDEAENYAKTFWDKRIASCNGSFYFVVRGRGRDLSYQQVYECKNLPVYEVTGQEVLPRVLSEADRLNGVDPQPIQWQGNGVFSFSTCKLHYIGEADWRPWQETGSWRFQLQRVKGRWAIDEITANTINVDNFYEVNCAFVQKYFRDQKLSD